MEKHRRDSGCSIHAQTTYLDEKRCSVVLGDNLPSRGVMSYVKKEEKRGASN